MSGSGREARPDVQEGGKAFPYVWEWTGGPLGFQLVVGSPSRMSRIGGEALPEVRE